MKLFVEKQKQNYDSWLFFAVLSLVAFGLVMTYSASSTMADKRYLDSLYFLKRQAVFVALGLCAMFAAMRTDYRVWRKVAAPALLICIVMLILVLVPGIGGSAGGASRWFRLGAFSLQPSEFAKLAMIIFMAFSLDRKQDKIKDFNKGFLPYMIVLGLMIVLLMLQPDLGSSLTLALVAIMMLLAAGTRPIYISSMAIIAAPVLYLAIFSVDYRRKRIMSFLDPWDDPLGNGFQIIQSWYGFARGGLTGAGLGEGRQKMFYLPEAHTDFILSVVAEELGFIAVAAIGTLFLLIVLRTIRMAIHAEDDFGRFLAFGIAALLGIQSSVNFAVATGVAPTKGLALPFISYGGSSLIITMFAAGILLNISSHVRPVHRGF